MTLPLRRFAVVTVLLALQSCSLLMFFSSVWRFLGPAAGQACIPPFSGQEVPGGRLLPVRLPGGPLFPSTQVSVEAFFRPAGPSAEGEPAAQAGPVSPGWVSIAITSLSNTSDKFLWENFSGPAAVASSFLW